MKNYNINIECASKSSIDAIKNYILAHFEGVVIIETSSEITTRVGERADTVLRTVPKKRA